MDSAWRGRVYRKSHGRGFVKGLLPVVTNLPHCVPRVSSLGQLDNLHDTRKTPWSLHRYSRSRSVQGVVPSTLGPVPGATGLADKNASTVPTSSRLDERSTQFAFRCDSPPLVRARSEESRRPGIPGNPSAVTRPRPTRNSGNAGKGRLLSRLGRGTLKPRTVVRCDIFFNVNNFELLFIFLIYQLNSIFVLACCFFWTAEVIICWLVRFLPRFRRKKKSNTKFKNKRTQSNKQKKTTVLRLLCCAFRFLVNDFFPVDLLCFLFFLSTRRSRYKVGGM